MNDNYDKIRNVGVCIVVDTEVFDLLVLRRSELN